jgi:hypothetical protein
MALRAIVVTRVAHGRSAPADDDCPFLVTREALERADCVDHVRDRRRRTIVGAAEAASRENLGALLRGHDRTFRQQWGQWVAQPRQRARVEVRVRADSLGTQLRVTGGGRRRGDLRGDAEANELTLLREARAETASRGRDGEQADDMPSPP